VDGFEIKEGNYMGIIDGKIQVVTENLEETTVQMVNKMLDDDSEIVTVIYGSDTTAAVADKVQAAIGELDDELEIEVHEGDQPVYPFIVSVE
jgi:dihydroxyacetone kinase-like predicted kinase